MQDFVIQDYMNEIKRPGFSERFENLMLFSNRVLNFFNFHRTKYLVNLFGGFCFH